MHALRGIAELAVCLGCGCASAHADPPAEVASTLREKSFSAPIPPGFERHESKEVEHIQAEGGIVLAQSLAPRLPQPFRANIIIMPLPNKGLDLSDSILCLSLGDNAAKSIGGKPIGVPIRVKRPAGATCEVVVGFRSEPNKNSRAAVLGDPRQLWMVTCNYDKRDPAALRGCESLLNGFRFAAVAQAPGGL